MLPVGGGCPVFKLHDTVLVVLQVVKGLGNLVVEAAQETLCLGGLLLEGMLSSIVVITTGIRAETLRRRFDRSNVTLADANVTRSRSIRLGVHVRLRDGIGLEHSGVRSGGWLAGELRAGTSRLLNYCFSSLDDLD